MNRNHTCPREAGQPDEHAERMERARLSLRGLALGDGFGGCFFWRAVAAAAFRGRLPPAPWVYSDDTIMAVSVVETLGRFGRIEQDFLAGRFAARFKQAPDRGYGGGAMRLLAAIAAGADWRAESRALFGGTGSMGNGGAMRAGPVGA
ncbi:MAG: ADP-ribosylglycohydrolase family protein, partial [Planctomycetota bacterium]